MSEPSFCTQLITAVDVQKAICKILEQQNADRYREAEKNVLIQSIGCSTYYNYCLPEEHKDQPREEDDEDYEDHKGRQEQPSRDERHPEHQQQKQKKDESLAERNAVGDKKPTLTQEELDKIQHTLKLNKVAHGVLKFAEDEKDDLVTIYCAEKKILHQCSIRSDWKIEDVKQVLSEADLAGFGDIKSQETRVDETIRKAKQISGNQVEISSSLVERIRVAWAEHFYPTQVDVQLYKLNIYDEGGHFAVHLDTPETRLVGTFLLRLHDTTACGLSVNGETIKRRAPGDWVAFFPDVPHYLPRIWDGYRIYLAFKIFAKPQPENTFDRHPRLVESLSQFAQPFGIILSRKYVLSQTSAPGLKGDDNVLIEALQSLPNKPIVDIFPIVITVRRNWWDDDTMYHVLPEERYTKKCKIYPFTEDIVKYLCGKVATLDEKWKNYPKLGFVYFRNQEDGAIQWSHQHEEPAEHTGNEARPGDCNSVYLSAAAVVRPRKQSMMGVR